MRAVILLLTACVLTLPTASAMAQTSIAVVDVVLLLTESKAAKNIQGQVKEYRESFLKDLSAQEKELRELEKTLLQQKTELSPEDFAKKRQEFEEKLLETRRDAQQKKRDLEIASAKATEKLQSKIVEVVQKISDDKEYDLVISAQDVVVGENSLNITEEAMKALNKEIKKISVDIE